MLKTALLNHSLMRQIAHISINRIKKMRHWQEYVRDYSPLHTRGRTSYLVLEGTYLMIKRTGG
eukprot:6928210-Ditylum_brightwellii.AAC.1